MFCHWIKVLIAFQAAVSIAVFVFISDRYLMRHKYLSASSVNLMNTSNSLPYIVISSRRTTLLPNAEVIPKFEPLRIPDDKDVRLEVERFLVEYKKNCSLQLMAKANNISRGNESFSNLCPCVPDTVVGRINVTFEAPQLGKLERIHWEVRLGGSWTPLSCTARQRVAVIIPFRDRQLHLRTLLALLHPMLQRQMLQYTIFVVEQKEPRVFNKASLMNVAFLHARAIADFDCIIFHDVDMLPEDDRNFYVCSSQPRHVVSAVDKWNYRLKYKTLFGGVTAFRPSHFEQVNGFSNQFYGWGGEDDDMYQRVKAQKMQVVRFPAEVARYTMIRHSRDSGNPVNTKKETGWSFCPKVYVVDGLNSVKYKLVANEQRPLYTWLLVSLPHHPSSFNIR